MAALYILILVIIVILFYVSLFTVEFLTDDNQEKISWSYFFKVFLHMPRHIWNVLWVRKDEFHRSLDLDIDLLLVLEKKDWPRYTEDLERRRKEAHYKSLKTEV